MLEGVLAHRSRLITTSAEPPGRPTLPESVDRNSRDGAQADSEEQARELLDAGYTVLDHVGGELERAARA